MDFLELNSIGIRGIVIFGGTKESSWKASYDSSFVKVSVAKGKSKLDPQQ